MFSVWLQLHLITLSRYGSVQVDIDYSMDYYPPTHGVGGMMLIGDQNSSGGPAYGLHFQACSGDAEPTQYVCGSGGEGMAPNVSIANIPERWSTYWFNSPPNYYYDVCVGGACPNWPYGGAVLRTSCDIVFSGGIPKGGSTYFTTINASSYYPYFQVTTNTVVPYVSFQDTLLKGQSAPATITDV